MKPVSSNSFSLPSNPWEQPQAIVVSDGALVDPKRRKVDAAAIERAEKETGLVIGIEPTDEARG